jgi:hypothetical protein
MEAIISLDQLEVELKDAEIKLRAILLVKRNLLDQQGKTLNTGESIIESQLALEILETV